MFHRMGLRAMAVAVAALALAPLPALAQNAAEVLKRASAAMGADTVKSIRFAGEGTGFTYGQAYKPGGPWPKITLHSYARTINYETASMRTEFVLSRAEPKGGGGYPLSGQQPNDQLVSGALAWNQTPGGPQAGPRFVMDRVHQLWISPQGAIKAAAKNNAKLGWREEGGKKLAVLSFTEPGRFSAKVFLDAQYRVARVESRLPDPVLGEVGAVTRYSGYRDFAGVMFPARIQQAQGGFPVLDLAVKEAQGNAPADIQAPEAVRAASEKVTTDKVAEGVWFVAGGTHHSVAIEMKDHLILVEAPLNDGRSVPVIEAVKALAPGKPIRYVVNTHNHFDHAGGLRAAAADGATIVTQGGNVPYFAKAFATNSKIEPDRLAKSGKKARFKAVEKKLVLGDGNRTVEIHRIGDSVHNDTFLMAYLPQEKLLIEADAYTPGPPNAPPPAVANANNVNLVHNIERLKLRVERILPLHGRVVPLTELYATAKLPMPK